MPGPVLGQGSQGCQARPHGAAHSLGETKTSHLSPRENRGSPEKRWAAGSRGLSVLPSTSLPGGQGKRKEPGEESTPCTWARGTWAEAPRPSAPHPLDGDVCKINPEGKRSGSPPKPRAPWPPISHLAMSPDGEDQALSLQNCFTEASTPHWLTTLGKSLPAPNFSGIFVKKDIDITPMLC